jgi:hypothetical protein
MALDQMRGPETMMPPQGFAKGGIASLKPMAREMAAAGRYGDTMLAHISPVEAQILRRYGGSGTINGFVSIAGGGILAPGQSPGTLTMTSGLSLADAAVLNYELVATDTTVNAACRSAPTKSGNVPRTVSSTAIASTLAPTSAKMTLASESFR